MQLGCLFWCLTWVQSHLTCSPPCNNNIFHLAWKKFPKKPWSNPVSIKKVLYESAMIKKVYNNCQTSIWLFPPIYCGWPIWKFAFLRKLCCVLLKFVEPVENVTLFCSPGQHHTWRWSGFIDLLFFTEFWRNPQTAEKIMSNIILIIPFASDLLSSVRSVYYK